MRAVNYTDEFLDFMTNASDNVKIKIKYVLDILINQPVINTKIAKKLTNTDLHEIRIQVNNEYRILCITIDHDNITQATKILFLSGFMKKSTKEYEKEIKKAHKILDRWRDKK